MTVQVASLVISAEDKASAALGRVGKAFAELEKTAKAAGSVDKLSAAMAKLREQAGAIDKMRGAWDGFKDARSRFGDARAEVERLGRAMKAAEAPSSQMAAAYRKAQREVSRAAAAFRDQSDAVKGAKRDLEGLGLSAGKMAAAENQIANAVRKANAELKNQGALLQHQDKLSRQAEQRVGRFSGVKTAAGALGLAAVHKAEGFSRSTVETYREFDKYGRQTKAFGNFTAEEMAKIVDMAIHKSAGTKFNDIQWLEGAKALGGRGVKAGSVMSILPEASNYGQAMGTTLPEAVAGLEGPLFAFQRDLSTPEKARAAARRTADIQVNAAKSFGLSHDDLKGGYEYGALAASQAGIKEEKLLAFMGLGKKLNIPGQAQGNAFNTMIAKILSPDQKGREALAAMGVNVGKFQTMPKALSVDNFGSMISQQYGVKLNGAARDKLGQAFSDQSVIGDPTKYAVAVRDALKGQIGINGAKDMNKVAGSAERFRRNNVQKVDADGLFNEIMKELQGGNLALANAIYGPKQARRIMAAIRDQKLWDESVGKVEGTPDGKAEGVAREMMGGFDGAVSRFENAIKNLETSIGRAFDDGGQGGFLTGITNKAGELVQALAEANPKVLQFGTGLAAAASGFVALKSLGLLASGFGLKGSAVALDGSAAALTRAAAALGGAGVVGDLPGKAGKPGLGNKLGRLGPLGFLGMAGAGAGAMIGAGMLLDEDDPHKNRMNGYKGAGDRAYKPNLGSYPAGWGAGGFDVGGGLGAKGGAFTTNREKTWGEALFGMPSFRGGRDPTKMNLPLPTGMMGGSLDALTGKASDTKASLDAIDGRTITVKADASVFDPMISKAGQLLKIFRELTGEASTATASVSSAARTSYSDT